MRLVESAQLHSFLTSLYVAIGTPENEASTVASHQVASNLVGHDSHGALKTSRYIKLVQEGRIVPGARFEVLKEAGATALIDGNWGFGFVMTDQALDLAIQKARVVGVAGVAVRRQGHIGRLGAYTARAAREGFGAMIVADSGRGPKSVAPFGGSDRRLGTNPMSISLPAGAEGCVTLDMATTVVAGGKVRLAAQEGREIPSDWIVDAQGRPTTDPRAYLSGGALRPLGGDHGHKGYALSFMVESLAAVLPGIGFGEDPAGFPNDGTFMLLWDIDQFNPIDEFKSEMSEFISYIKASPAAPGHTEVFYPGEIEERTRAERLKNGIPIDDGVLNALRDRATQLDVPVPESFTVAH